MDTKQKKSKDYKTLPDLQGPITETEIGIAQHGLIPIEHRIHHQEIEEIETLAKASIMKEAGEDYA